MLACLYRVTLTDEQRRGRCIRTRHAGLAPSTRDRLALARRSDAGWRAPRIARHRGQHEQTVRAWITACLAGGCDALPNKPRGGTASALTAAMLAGVRAAVAAGTRTWTAAHLADWLAERHGLRLSADRLPHPAARAGSGRGRGARGRARGPRKKGAAGLLDLCHLDEAGFALTLPTTSSWCPRGARRRGPDQAPRGRRGNALGASFTHGPDAGRLECRSWAVLPKRRAKRPRATPAARAAAQGLTVDEGGPIDAARLIACLWPLAGRPADAAPTWRRARPLVIALGNSAVHTGQAVVAARPLLAAAHVELVSLARYCPEQSASEPAWNEVQQQQLPQRSFAQVAALKRAVDDALAHTARQLQQACGKPTNIQRLAA